MNDFLQVCIGIFVCLCGFACFFLPACIIIYKLIADKKTTLFNLNVAMPEDKAKRKDDEPWNDEKAE